VSSINEADIRAFIQERIDYYQCEHGCQTASLNSEVVEEELFSAMSYYYPYSAFELLLGLQWCLDHHENVHGDPSNEFYAALTAVDAVYYESPAISDRITNRQREANAESRRFKQEEVERWPLEDRRAVRDWLSLAANWPVML